MTGLELGGLLPMGLVFRVPTVGAVAFAAYGSLASFGYYRMLAVRARQPASRADRLWMLAGAVWVATAMVDFVTVRMDASSHASTTVFLVSSLATMPLMVYLLVRMLHAPMHQPFSWQDCIGFTMGTCFFLQLAVGIYWVTKR